MGMNREQARAAARDLVRDLGGPPCGRCGEPKRPGTFCVGCDQCTGGPGGTPDECCTGWGDHCCRCGTDYALGQL
jgi:hypothetical protein